MKDSIQQTSGEVAIVIFDAPLPPKYFRVTKRTIKTLFVFVPILLVLTMGCFFIWGIAQRLKHVPTPKIPDVIMAEDSKVAALEADIKTLEQSNNELVLKLSSQPGTATSEDPFLMTIKRPYGMQNFLSENRVTLDQFQFEHDATKASLKFQIISSRPETRVTGHVLVFMISENGAMAYPKEANLSIAQGIKYSAGEPFAVSRLRPTNAEFMTHLTGESVKFMIYIFSREGDLLLIRETESFKAGNK